VNQATAQALADGYAAYNALGDLSVLRMFSKVHIFRLEDGLVVEHWAVRDDATMLDSVTA